LKMSNFAGGIQSLGFALKRYLIPNHSPLLSLLLARHLRLCRANVSYAAKC
jgi:hypothetical protein